MGKNKNKANNGNNKQAQHGNEQNAKAGGEEQNAKAGGEEKKKIKEPNKEKSIVLKIDIHCEGCASKMIKLARSFHGVQSATADVASGKLTVEGLVDPVKLREFMATKTKKKIDLINQSTSENNKENKSGGNANGGGHNKTDSPAKKSTDKEAPAKTAIIKMNLHCQGCIEKIQKIATKTKGVVEVSIDRQNETVTVKGIMDVNVLVDALKGKFKRNVDIGPQKIHKEEGENSTEKKKKGNGPQKPNSGGGAAGGENGGEKVTANGNRVETPPVIGPSYELMSYGSGFASPSSYGGPQSCGSVSGLTAPPPAYGSFPGSTGRPPTYGPVPVFTGRPPTYGLVPAGPPQLASASTMQAAMGGGYTGATHVVYNHYDGEDYGYSFPAHMKFSDENPNACSVM